MRLLTLTFNWCFATCFLSTGGRGSSHGRGGHQGGRAWEPLGGLRQLRRLQDHGVNLEHLSARVDTRSPANRNHLGVRAGVQAPEFRSGVQAPEQKLDVSRLDEVMRKRRRAEGRWRVSHNRIIINKNLILRFQ